MATPLNRRANDVFLSHSSRDKDDFVDGLHDWLTRKAGLAVWYDRNLPSGPVAEKLGKAIDSCKAAILVLSPSSVRSGWVGAEYSVLAEEQANSDFRIVTLRLGNVPTPPGLLRAYKHIEASDGPLTPHAAALLMDSLFGGLDGAASRAVYLSRGWRPAERPTVDKICTALKAAGLGQVCDWTDQPHYDEQRVRRIIEGTGGLVAILPHRGDGGTSRYMIGEIAMARGAGLPVLAFVHRDVVLKPEWSLADAQRFDDGLETRPDLEVDELFNLAIEQFAQAWRTPPRGEHVFLGHSLDRTIDDQFATAKTMLSRITGLPVRVGGLVSGQDVQGEIVRLIREAAFCIIDITNLTHPGLPDKINFALNSCIEAGVALGCEQTLYLTCRGKRRTPPFMFRNKQVWFYEDDLELIGVLRQIAAKHMRMVL